MAWLLSEPPKAKADDYSFKDWIYQVWKFLKFSNNTVSVSANYSAKMEDHFIFVNASGGARDVTLPFAKGNRGKEIIIIKIESSGNAVSALPRGTETINGAVSASTSTRTTPIRVISDNSNWILW